MPEVYAEAEKLVEILGGELSGEKRLELARNRAKEILLSQGRIPCFPVIPADARQGPIVERRAILQVQAEFEQRLR